jgi:thiamine thiazole synthase
MVKFSKASESDITKAILEEFNNFLSEYVSSDVVIVGAGPSGLMAGKRLAESGVKVLIVEENNYPGGGFWLGGFLMNIATFRDPGQRILAELGVPYKEVEPGLFTVDAVYACSKLIASSCSAGVRILNMVKFDDLILKENNRVSGVVINWAPVSALPRQLTCVDPVALEAKLVIDATGHDARVCKALSERGLLDIKGFGGMWVEKSEDLVVENTGEVYPGLIITGMAVATVYGISRMGPTFSAMLYSGIKAADEAKRILSSLNIESSQEERVRL